MTMSPAEVGRFAPKLRDLEAEDEVVCAWRYQGNQVRGPQSWVRGALRAVRDIGYRTSRPVLPQPGQVVILSDGATPATYGNLRRIMVELKRRGRPAFLVTTAKTRAFLAEGNHAGHVETVQLLASLPAAERRAVSRRAAGLADGVRAVLGEQDGDSAAWITAGLTARAVARRWVAGAGAVVVDADFEAVRKGFLLGAADAGVPTMMLQHGTWSSAMFPIHTDVTACWGELSRRETAEFGLPWDRSAALGSPRWDDLVNHRPVPSAATRARCGGREGRPFVVLISSAHSAAELPDLFGPYFEAVTRLVESDLDVAVRLHPSENGSLEYYRGRVSDSVLSRLRVVPHEVGLHEALTAADVVYHIYSAASLEAMLLGVPLLFERGRETIDHPCPFPDLGGGAWCGPGDVVDRCREFAAGPARAELLHRQEQFLGLALANRGRATQAVTDTLESLIEQRRLVGNRALKPERGAVHAV